jgi:hypothetical protein
LLGDEVAEILPNLLPGSEFIGEQNIEIDRTTLKADLVYNVQYRGNPHILNEELLRFHYRVLPLWKLDAQQFVLDRVICMYTLLPAMKGASAPLLLRAIEEMKQRYKEAQLGHHLVRFRTILRRSGTVSLQDKQEVEDHLDYYDSLLDQDPYIQEQKALERVLGRNEGIYEGRIQELQQMLLEVVEERFPSLAGLAQQKVKQTLRPEVLRQTVKLMFAAPDEATARRLLNIPMA